MSDKLPQSRLDPDDLNVSEYIKSIIYDLKIIKRKIMSMDKHLTYEFEIQIFPQIQSNVHHKLDLNHLTLNKVGKNPDLRFNT